MKLKRLKPIKPDLKIEEKIRAKILDYLKRELYQPLIETIDIKPEKILNSSDDLLRAIQSGQISYSNGKFMGRFNSTLSRGLRELGAKWDRKQGSWNIPQSKLTIELRNAISLSESKFSSNISQIRKKLIDFDSEKFAEKLDFSKLFDTALYKVNENIEKNLESITVQLKLSDKERKEIAEGYNNNLKLYIKNFTEEETVRLRAMVEESVYKGKRYEAIVADIQKSFGVSKNKAKFLARQENNLMTAKLTETRMKDVGLMKYEWQCVVGSPKHPVRPLHKEHNGKIFSWDNPPVVDEKGNRKHPGEDYNCRCIAVPVVVII